MAAAEIHKHPELSHAEIAQRTKTSKATAIRAERILNALTRRSRLKRAEQRHKSLFTNNRALAQRQRQETQERERRIAEIERRNAERNRILQRINSLKEELKQTFNPFKQDEIIKEIKKEKAALKQANFLTMQTAEIGF